MQAVITAADDDSRLLTADGHLLVDGRVIYQMNDFTLKVVSGRQAAAIHETTATMEELKHASAQIAENAGAVARVAEETLGAAR